MKIIVDDLRGPEIKALLETHLELMRSQSPPESTHALDLDELRKPEITFWTGWENNQLLGCAALKEMDSTQGEIKSMHTTKNARGKGIGAQMLKHLEQNARARGYKRLSLETGSPDGFAPARKMYEKFGYEECSPFGNYVEDSFSVFMTKQL